MYHTNLNSESAVHACNALAQLNLSKRMIEKTTLFSQWLPSIDAYMKKASPILKKDDVK